MKLIRLINEGLGTPEESKAHSLWILEEAILKYLRKPKKWEEILKNKSTVLGTDYEADEVRAALKKLEAEGVVEKYYDDYANRQYYERVAGKRRPK